MTCGNWCKVKSKSRHCGRLTGVFYTANKMKIRLKRSSSDSLIHSFIESQQIIQNYLTGDNDLGRGKKNAHVYLCAEQVKENNRAAMADCVTTGGPFLEIAVMRLNCKCKDKSIGCLSTWAICRIRPSVLCKLTIQKEKRINVNVY